MINIIEKDTAAADGEHYFTKDEVGCMIVVDGDLGSDTISVKSVGISGGTTQGYEEGTALILSQTNPWVKIPGPVNIRVVKGVTSNDVGVDIHGIG